MFLTLINHGRWIARGEDERCLREADRAEIPKGKGVAKAMVRVSLREDSLRAGVSEGTGQWGKKDLAMTSNMSTFVPDCTGKARPDCATRNARRDRNGHSPTYIAWQGCDCRDGREKNKKLF